MGEVIFRLAWASWFEILPFFASHIMQSSWFSPVLPTHHPVAQGGDQIPLSLRFPIHAIPELASSFIDGADMVAIKRHGPLPLSVACRLECNTVPPPPVARRLECNIVPPPPSVETLDGGIPLMPARPPPRP